MEPCLRRGRRIAVASAVSMLAVAIGIATPTSARTGDARAFEHVAAIGQTVFLPLGPVGTAFAGG